MDDLLILALKLLNGCKSAVKDIGVNGGEVSIMSLKLACIGSNEVNGGKWLDEVRDKECHKGDVKGKDGFNTMCHVQ
jgi:hypothetical protein